MRGVRARVPFSVVADTEQAFPVITAGAVGARDQVPRTSAPAALMVRTADEYPEGPRVPPTPVGARVNHAVLIASGGGGAARERVPVAAVFPRVPQALELAAARGPRGRQRVPRAPVLARVPETLQVAAAGRGAARRLVPRALVVERVAQTLQAAGARRGHARRQVPRAPVLARVPQARQVAAVRRELARRLVPPVPVGVRDGQAVLVAVDRRDHAHRRLRRPHAPGVHVPPVGQLVPARHVVPALRVGRRPGVVPVPRPADQYLAARLQVDARHHQLVEGASPLVVARRVRDLHQREHHDCRAASLVTPATRKPTFTRCAAFITTPVSRAKRVC